MLTRGRKSVMAPGDDSTNSSASGGTYSKMTGNDKPSIAAAANQNRAGVGAGANSSHAAAANTSFSDGSGKEGVGAGMPSLSERLLAEQELHFQKQREQQQQQQQKSVPQQKQQSNTSVTSVGTNVHQSVISSGTMSKKKKILSSPAAVSAGGPSSSNSTGSSSKNDIQKLKMNSEFSMHDLDNEDSFGKKINVSGRMDNSYYTDNNNTAAKSQASKVSLTQKLKRSTPFKHTKRTMHMVYAAFGQCTKKEDDDFDDESTMNLEAGDFEKQALMYSSGGNYFRRQQQMKRQKKVLQFVTGCLLFVGVMGMIRRRHGTHNGKHSDPPGMLSTLPLLPTSYTRVFSSRKSNPRHIVHQAVFPQYFQGLSNLTTVYNPNKETPYFWDVHFSGESIAEAVFGHCHGLIQACEFGLRQPEFTEDKLATFELDGIKYVNVDTTTLPGIIRANKLQLSQSHIADIVISPHMHEMAARIFSSDHPARMFALFRHPVDRAIGMYYYLQKATWDSMYNPSLAQMTMEEYAKSQFIENNWVTRFLVHKPSGKLTHSDMLLAKKIIKFKCLVGIYDDIEASLVRFERYFGWGVHDRAHKHGEIPKCRKRFLDLGDRNTLGHPVSVKEGRATETNDGLVKVGSKAWDAIVRQNIFDMELYEFAKQIYKIQGEQIFGVAG